MPSQLITTGLDRLDAKLRGLLLADWQPLLIEWRAILEEDNERGALAGLDGWGKPLAPVTYRPRVGTDPISMAPLDYNNLRRSAYLSLSGPPLAPRGAGSRIVTNFRTAHGGDGPGRWYAQGAWEDVLSVKGTPFLPFHFRGEGRLPRRDLAHVRPSALAKARQALRDFVKRLLG